MSRVNLNQSITAVAKNLTVPFSTSGGTPPYTYSVLIDGAGGSINAQGLYLSPNKTGIDFIQVEDSIGVKDQRRILVGSPIQLFCEVIQRELELTDRQVYLWDQKYDVPIDFQMYVAVGELSLKSFSNVNRVDSLGNEMQAVNFQSLLSVDVMSRGAEARERRGEVVAALGSSYAQQQQNLNSFFIAKLPSAFVNLSEQDGSAIPYRYNLTVAIQYFETKIKQVPCYTSFDFEVEANT